jgi:hypothetical protein
MNRVENECWKLNALFQMTGPVHVNEDVFKSDRLPELRDGFTSCSINGLKACLFQAAEMHLEGWTKERAEWQLRFVEKFWVGNSILLCS